MALRRALLPSISTFTSGAAEPRWKEEMSHLKHFDNIMPKKEPEELELLDYDFILSNSVMQQQQQQQQQQQDMTSSAYSSYHMSYVPDISDVSPSGGFVAELMRPDLDPAYLQPLTAEVSGPANVNSNTNINLHGKFVVKTTNVPTNMSTYSECDNMAASEPPPALFMGRRIKQEVQASTSSSSLSPEEHNTPAQVLTHSSISVPQGFNQSHSYSQFAASSVQYSGQSRHLSHTSCLTFKL
ncbi:Krueppel-like factor 4 [Bagarius yarrelli]|uniref:Krueppel-like factor 4 n=1 Tax=Bagarius yarrelli TaxID=175774 RepID=A0A556TWX4_BAGYA|nr:Krueppel-like factor 4 [Bagarius yarrelli]